MRAGTRGALILDLMLYLAGPDEDREAWAWEVLVSAIMVECEDPFDDDSVRAMVQTRAGRTLQVQHRDARRLVYTEPPYDRS